MSGDVHGQWRPDQDPDGQRRRCRDTACPARRRRVRGPRPHLPDRRPGLHAERRAGRGRPAHRPRAHRHQGHPEASRASAGRLVVTLLTAATVVIVGIDRPSSWPSSSRSSSTSAAYKPRGAALAVTPEGRLHVASPSAAGPILQRPGLVIYRFGAGLYYTNATRLRKRRCGILEAAVSRRSSRSACQLRRCPDVTARRRRHQAGHRRGQAPRHQVRHLPGRAGCCRPARTSTAWWPRSIGLQLIDVIAASDDEARHRRVIQSNRSPTRLKRSRVEGAHRHGRLGPSTVPIAELPARAPRIARPTPST